MISFIVIGRNEEKHLNKCFKSIRTLVKYNNIKELEILYVDSDSSDRSIEIAKKNNIDKIIQIKNQYNAAIGRNIGAKQAIGEVFVFMDGDMEIQAEFMPFAMKPNGELKYDLVAGNIKQIYYDKRYNIVKEELAYKNVRESIYKPITGGAFIIKSKLYHDFNGMDNRFRRSADPELGIRLARKGIMLVFLPQVFVKHHTFIPSPPNITDLLKWNWLYGNLLMYKINLFNKYSYKRMLSHDSTLIVLLVSLLLGVFINTWILLLYPTSLIIRVKKARKQFIKPLFYYLIRDLLVLLFYLPYYIKPIKTENIEYIIIKE